MPTIVPYVPTKENFHASESQGRPRPARARSTCPGGRTSQPSRRGEDGSDAVGEPAQARPVHMVVRGMLGSRLITVVAFHASSRGAAVLRASCCAQPAVAVLDG